MMGEQTLGGAQIPERLLKEAETEQKGRGLPFSSLKPPVRMLCGDVFTGVGRKG